MVMCVGWVQCAVSAPWDMAFFVVVALRTR
jgi:hypothetical protein